MPLPFGRSTRTVGRASVPASSHALASVPESVGPASEVPFFIYTSERYEEQFPDVCERIAASRQKDYRTDALIYTVMDIAGVQFKDKSEINGTSILE